MPTYEYECEQCGHAFTQFQSMMDAPVEKCPECAGKVRRLIGTGAGVIFTGSGFYARDNKRDRPRCGRDVSCCGRSTTCDTKPCDD